MSEAAPTYDIKATPIEELQTRALTWPERATTMTIADDATYKNAAGLLRDIKALRGEIARSCNPVVEAAHKAHKAACKQRTDAEAPLLEAEQTIKGKIGAYTDEQERLAREEQIRLEAEQRRREEEARLAEASELEAAGDSQAADAVLAEPSVAPAPVARRPVPKVAGIATRENWKAEVVDLLALVKAVAEGAAPLAFVQADTKALNQMARSLKREMRVPGVRAVSEASVAASAR